MNKINEHGKLENTKPRNPNMTKEKWDIMNNAKKLKGKNGLQ